MPLIDKLSNRYWKGGGGVVSIYHITHITNMTNSNHFEFYSKQFSFRKININYDIRYVIYTHPNLVLPVERYHL